MNKPNIPGAPEPHRTHPDEEDFREFRESMEWRICEYQRERRSREAAEWLYDNRLPDGH